MLQCLTPSGTQVTTTSQGTITSFHERKFAADYGNQIKPGLSGLASRLRMSQQEKKKEMTRVGFEPTPTNVDQEMMSRWTLT